LTIDEIRRMSRRAYVNRSEGWTKVIFGKDELQIVFKGLSGTEAKKAIAQGNFKVKDVVPADICETVVETRAELKRLSEKLVAVYSQAERLPGFVMYDQKTEDATNKIAYEITNIMTYGKIKEGP